MITLLRKLDSFWYMPATAARLAHVRLLVGAFSLVFLVVMAPNFLAAADQAPERFHPVGLIALLSAPLPSALVKLTFAFTCLTGIAFTVGLRYRWSGPLYALLVLGLTSYRSSWGMLFHTENLMTLHLLVLGAAPAADTLSFDAPRPARETIEDAHGRYGWSLRAAGAITVVAYVIAGAAKLEASGWHWASGEVLQNQVAFDNLRKIELGSMHSPLGALMAPHRAAFAPLAILSLCIELGAPLVWLGGRTTRLWIAAAMFFHWGVLALMAIAFPYPLTGIAFVSFLQPETWGVLAPLRRWLAPRGAATT